WSDRKSRPARTTRASAAQCYCVASRGVQRNGPCGKYRLSAPGSRCPADHSEARRPHRQEAPPPHTNIRSACTCTRCHKHTSAGNDSCRDSTARPLGGNNTDELALRVTRDRKSVVYGK